MMILRDYQQQVVDKVIKHLETNQRCCVSLATGGGKTVIFSEIVNLLKGRTLICVHREELVHQTSSTLKKQEWKPTSNDTKQLQQRSEHTSQNSSKH